MKGLLLKDYYMIKSSLWMTIIIMMPLGLFSVLIAPDAILFCIPMLFSIILSMLVNNTIAIDSTILWNKITVVLPVKRKDVIVSKYISYFLACVIGVMLGLLIEIIGIKNIGNSGFTLVLTAAVGIIFPVLSATISFPLTYLFNKKADAWVVFYVLSFALPVVVFYIAITQFSNVELSIRIIGLSILFIATLLLFVLSCFITSKIYTQQDI